MFPHTLSQIMRGVWAIRPEDALAQKGIILNILTSKVKNDYTTTSKLSDDYPIIRCSDSGECEENRFDSAPKNSVAVISFYGTMVKYGDLCTYGTAEIADVINEASDCDQICAIVLRIDSGGGAVNSIAPLTCAINYAQSKNKPVIALCDVAASAAYWVAAACDHIMAENNISSEFGSIGVMCSFVDVRPVLEKQGYKFHEIYSDMSQDKNAAFPAALRGEYDKIKEEDLNPLALSFRDHVIKHRPNLIESTPGILSGKMFWCNDALSNGLIDSIGNIDDACALAKKRAGIMAVNNLLNQ